MTVLPANVSRTSNLLTSQIALGNISRTNVSLLNVQTQLATGRLVNRASDDPVAAAAIQALNSRLQASEQRSRNLTHASTVVNTLDAALGEANQLVDQANSIASSQIGINSDAGTRANQAVVVDSLIQTLFTTANRETAGVHLFAGSTPGVKPVVQQAGGYRYVARGSGLFTDVGLGDVAPITLGGANAIGEVSARLRSTLNLNPNLTSATKLSDLTGARGLGVTPGVLTLQFGAGPVTQVDFSTARSAGDVATQLTSAIRQYETTNSVTILGPGGVTISGGGFSVDVPAGSLSIADVTGGSVASDLGLGQAAFTAANPAGLDTDPKLTLETRLTSIPGLTPPLDSIRLRLTSGSVGATALVRDVDLSSAQTIDDVRNLIESTNLGVRLEVNAAGTGIDLSNEIAGQVLSVEETPGGVDTATLLGVRSFTLGTSIADFNFGRGVGVVDGRADPVTGTVPQALNTDFRITLGNGQAFDVDLRPQDLTSVQSVLNRINSEFTTAIGQAPINASAPPLAAGQFTAGIASGPNGFTFVQTVGPGALTVATQNNSPAARDLGLLGGTYDSATSTLQAQDRAGVRVDNLFSDLLDLRAALVANDSSGITLAAERLTSSGERLTQAHALVGSYAQRIEQTATVVEDTRNLDTQTKSNLEDLDYTEAATRFSLLQTQLQASLQTAGAFQSRTLLDFLR